MRCGAAAVLCLIAVGPACSLIVDTDAVRARRDGGVANLDARAPGEDAAVDASVTDDAAAPDARADDATAPDASADDDAAAPDAAAPDATPSPCARPDATVLSCGAPIPLTSGRDLGFVSIAARDQGFITALVEDQAIVARVLDGDGAVLETRRLNPGTRPTALQVAASGARWALGAVPGLGHRMLCASSQATGTTTITTSGLVDDVAVAISPGGLVAMGGIEGYTFNTMLERAIAAQPGCPTSASAMQPAYYTRSVAAMHVPGAADDEFRFAVTAVHPNLEDSVLAEVAGSGTQFNWIVFGGLGVRWIEAAPATLGSHMAMAYVWRDADTNLYGLWGALHRVDFGGPPATDRAIAESITDSDFASCGDALVAAYLTEEGRGRISASFLRSDVSLGFVGATDTYDVACMVSATGAELDVACGGGKLAVLYTQGTRADLYLCDLPTLP